MKKLIDYQILSQFCKKRDVSQFYNKNLSYDKFYFLIKYKIIDIYIYAMNAYKSV